MSDEIYEDEISELYNVCTPEESKRRRELGELFLARLNGDQTVSGHVACAFAFEAGQEIGRLERERREGTLNALREIEERNDRIAQLEEQLSEAQDAAVCECCEWPCGKDDPEVGHHRAFYCGTCHANTKQTLGDLNDHLMADLNTEREKSAALEQKLTEREMELHQAKLEWHEERKRVEELEQECKDRQENEDAAAKTLWDCIGGRDDARAECAALREALAGLLKEEWATYEGNLEASGHASVDDLERAREALSSSTIGAEYAAKVKRLVGAARRALGGLMDGRAKGPEEILEEALEEWE